MGFVLYYFFDDKASALSPIQTQENFATGLNDATFSGAYNKSGNATFTVTIDGVTSGSGCIELSGPSGVFIVGNILVGGILEVEEESVMLLLVGCVT